MSRNKMMEDVQYLRVLLPKTCGRTAY